MKKDQVDNSSELSISDLEDNTKTTSPQKRKQRKPERITCYDKTITTTTTGGEVTMDKQTDMVSMDTSSCSLKLPVPIVTGDGC